MNSGKPPIKPSTSKMHLLAPCQTYAFVHIQAAINNDKQVISGFQQNDTKHTQKLEEKAGVIHSKLFSTQQQLRNWGPDQEIKTVTAMYENQQIAISAQRKKDIPSATLASQLKQDDKAYLIYFNTTTTKERHVVSIAQNANNSWSLQDRNSQLFITGNTFTEFQANLKKSMDSGGLNYLSKNPRELEIVSFSTPQSPSITPPLFKFAAPLRGFSAGGFQSFLPFRFSLYNMPAPSTNPASLFYKMRLFNLKPATYPLLKPYKPSKS